MKWIAVVVAVGIGIAPATRPMTLEQARQASVQAHKTYEDAIAIDSDVRKARSAIAHAKSEIQSARDKKDDAALDVAIVNLQAANKAERIAVALAATDEKAEMVRQDQLLAVLEQRNADATIIPHHAP